MLLQKQNQVVGVFMKDINFLNYDKREERMILSSMNNDMDLINHTFRRPSFRENDSMHQEINNRILEDPENEDFMQEQIRDNEADDDFFMSDYFVQTCFIKTTGCKKTTLNVCQMQVDINDGVIRKIYDTVLADIPAMAPSQYAVLKPVTPRLESTDTSEIVFKLQGMNALIRDKKDRVNLKVFSLAFKQTKRPGEKQTHISLKNYMVIQDDLEIFLKHQGSERNNFSQNEELDSELDDFDVPLISFKETKTSSMTTRQVSLSNMLLIVDVKALTKIASVTKSFDSLTGHIISQLSAPQSSTSTEPVSKSLTDSSFKVSIKDSYCQIPVREGKNSLFLEIDNFQVKIERIQAS